MIIETLTLELCLVTVMFLKQSRDFNIRLDWLKLICLLIKTKLLRPKLLHNILLAIQFVICTRYKLLNNMIEFFEMTFRLGIIFSSKSIN